MTSDTSEESFDPSTGQPLPPVNKKPSAPPVADGQATNNVSPVTGETQPPSGGVPGSLPTDLIPDTVGNHLMIVDGKLMALIDIDSDITTHTDKYGAKTYMFTSPQHGNCRQHWAFTLNKEYTTKFESQAEGQRVTFKEIEQDTPKNTQRIEVVVIHGEPFFKTHGEPFFETHGEPFFRIHRRRLRF